MTLDPVHLDGIVDLAARISPGVDETDHREFADTVWEDFLDPLRQGGTDVIEPVGEQRRGRVDAESVALAEDPFPTRHGLDSGTINPTTFKNGVVLDVAQAAMSAVPSELELHRARTVVATVHANDVTVQVGDDDWLMDDDGYARKRILQAPRVDRFEQHVVHVLSLYLAESQHALTQAEVVDDLLVLDGPLYPKGLLEWKGRDSRLEDLLAEDTRPRDVAANYLRLIERFVEREVPLIGFVKSPTTRTITRAVRSNTGNAPWVNDTALFKQVLERRADGERLTDELTFTNWFVSRGGPDRVFSTAGDALGLDRKLGPGAYETAFFAVYDPRIDLLFRVETPFAFARDPDLRERIRRQVLKGVALNRGPPESVAKADELARISREEKATLQDALERTLDSDREREYDEERWGIEAAEY
ncbi:MAG: DNA double-strand break repair nuclease NurA [Halobacteriales archaeon]